PECSRWRLGWRHGPRGSKTQAHIIDRPLARGVAQRGAAQFCHFRQKRGALSRGYRRHKTLRERLQPTNNVAWQGCWARHESDRAHDESLRFKFVAILLHRWEVPGINSVSIDATPAECTCEGVDDRCRVARAAALANKPTTRFQGSPNAGDDDGCLRHPMQSRIGKNGIKFLREWQGLPIHDMCIQP